MSAVDDLLSELEDIHKIVGNLDNRNLSEVQRSIMMKSRIFSIKNLMNQIMLDTETEVEKKIANSIKIVAVVKTLLSYEPKEHDLTYWYELHIFHRMMVASVIQANGQAGKLGLIGIAHTLSEILLGIETRDPTSHMVDKDHPEYTRRIMIAYNLANADTVIYGALLHLLPFIGEQEAYTYIEKLMNGFVILNNIITEHWDVKRYLEAKVSIADLSQRVQGAVVLSLAPATIAIGMYNIFNKFNNGIPEKLYRKGIIEAGGADELIKNSLNFFEYSQNLMNEILDHIANSERYRNFDVSTSPIIQIFNFQMNNAKIITETFAEVLLYEKTNDIRRFEGKAREIMDLLNSYHPYFTNEQFLKSSMGEAMGSYLEYYLPLISLYIYITGKSEELDRFKEIMGVFLSEEGRKYFPKSTLNYLISYTTILLKHNVQKFMTELPNLIDTAELLEENLAFFPRENVSVNILLAFFNYIQGQEVNIAKIQASTKSIVEATGEHELKIIEYTEYLLKAFNNEEAVFQNDIDEKKWLLDPYSYIYPDFSELLRSRGMKEIVYYPVNIWQDAILRGK